MRADPATLVLAGAGFVLGLGLTPAPRLAWAVARADADARLWMAKGVKQVALRLTRS